VHITTVDSNSVAVTDGTNQTQVQNKVIDWDTTIVPGSCASQSTYRFMQNGILQINDSCNLLNPVMQSNWAITQTNSLAFASPEIYAAGPAVYSLGGIGLVTQVNKDEFTFNNQQSTLQSYKTSFGPNNSTINTLDKILINVFTTYKSR